MKMTNLEKLFVNSPGHSRQVSSHAEKLLKLIDVKAGQTYLDVGCGNGAAPISIAQKYGLHVTGIDVDPDQIRLAEQQGKGIKNLRFLAMDGTHLPFQGEEFDIVSTNKVMHHIPNWEAAFDEMVRVLKPGGYLIYSDLVFPGWLVTIGKTVAGSFMGLPTKAALTALMTKHRLSPVHLSTTWLDFEAIYQKSL